MATVYCSDCFRSIQLSERAFIEGQPELGARCSSCMSLRAIDSLSTSHVVRVGDDVGTVDTELNVVEQSRKRVRRGGRGRKGKPRSVSPSMSITSLCTGVYRAVLGDDDYVPPLDRLAVVLDEKKFGYSYVDLLLPSKVTEAVRVLGSSPTLRRLLRLGPSKFKPVDTLNQTYVYVGSLSGRVVSSPTSDGAYAKFWAIVRSMPVHELSYEWRAAIGGRWVKCNVPCVAWPGYTID